MEEIIREAEQETGKGGARLQGGGGAGKAVGIALGVLVGAAAAGYVGLCAYVSSQNTFYPNSSINGVAVGGLTVEAAQSALEQALFTQEIRVVEQDTGETAAVLTLEDLGYKREDFAGEAQARMAEARQGGFLESGVRYIGALTNRYPGGYTWPDPDRGALEQTVERLCRDLGQQPVDTTYQMTDTALEITKARDGRTVDQAALTESLLDMAECCRSGYTAKISYETRDARTITARSIYDELSGEMKNAGYDPETKAITPEQTGIDFDAAAAQSALDSAAPGETIRIPAVVQEPEVTAANLKDVLFRDVLGEHSTTVSGGAGRVNNVRLSAAACNGVVLNAGEVFSYNETTGQRTVEKGYQMAPAYISGETVDTIGGGICQTSSTMYYACLKADLEITERYAHRYVPSYITKGMDATVSWGWPDYKFTNNTGYPMMIECTMSGSTLTVRLLGTNVDGHYAKMTYEQLSSTPYEVVYEDDPSLAPGQEVVKTTPYTGCLVKTYRHVYDAAGNLISSSYEDTSSYKSRNKVILRGVQPETTETTPPTPAPGPTGLPGLDIDPGPADTTPPENTAPETPPETAPAPEPPVPEEQPDNIPFE